MELKLEITPSVVRHKYSYENVVNNPEFKEWLKDSKIVDTEGSPQVFYHGTVKSFDCFDPDKGEFGNHFGSLPQSERRSEIAYINSSDPGEHPKILPVFVKIRNPFYISGDPGIWNHFGTLFNHILQSNRMGIQIMQNLQDNIFKIKSLKDLKEYLESCGFDGIVYRNSWEGGSGEDSVITFHKNQTWSLYASAPM